MKVLLIGDNIPARNYGAVATTESLLDLIHKNATNVELKTIDTRYFFGTAPKEGLPPYDIDLYRRGGDPRRIWKGSSVPTSAKPIIQECYDNYPGMVDKVLKGEILQYEKNLIEETDMVVINPEGAIVNGTDNKGFYRPQGRYLLFMAYLSKVVFNKPCFIINHSVDPQNLDIEFIIQNVYPKLDGVYVREKFSLKYLNEIGVKNAEYVPDILWTHDFENDPEVKCPKCLENFDFSKPYICLGDSSGLKNAYSEVSWDVTSVYCALIDKLKETLGYNIIFVNGHNGYYAPVDAAIVWAELPYVRLANCSYHELYYVLKNAKLFISGRWHASIMSLIGHTPVILWGGDCFKTNALHAEIGCKGTFYDVKTIPRNIYQMCDDAVKVLNTPHDDCWAKVEEMKKLALKNVDVFTKDFSKKKD